LFFYVELQAQIMNQQTCKQRGAIPVGEALRSRMEIIAALNGLQMDDGCTAFMEQALNVSVAHQAIVKVSKWCH
jgi:hypothetical protein